jgi:hypothetical protein
MLGNHPDHFEDLKMHNNTEVEGIKGGLDIRAQARSSSISNTMKEGYTSLRFQTASTYLI